jgi:hypothetical protein
MQNLNVLLMIVILNGGNPWKKKCSAIELNFALLLGMSSKSINNLLSYGTQIDDDTLFCAEISRCNNKPRQGWLLEEIKRTPHENIESTRSSYELLSFFTQLTDKEKPVEHRKKLLDIELKLIFGDLPEQEGTRFKTSYT